MKVKGASIVAVALFSSVVSFAETRSFSVNAPNALALVAEQMGRQYGCPILFEGPEYEHPDDLVDTIRIAKPTLESLANCDSSSEIIARFCYFTAEYTVDPTTGEPTNIATAVREIVADYNDGNNPGRFAVVESIAGPCIVPTSIRDRFGKWKDVQPLLGRPISLSVTNATNLEALKSVLHQVQELTPITIYPVSLRPEQGSITLKAENELARDVLARLLVMPGYGGSNNVFSLYYAPCPPAYGFEEDATVKGPLLRNRDEVPWSMVGNVSHPDYRGEPAPGVADGVRPMPDVPDAVKP